MHTPPEHLPQPRPGHYEIDVVASRVTFRTRHMFGLGPVRGTMAIRSGAADITDPIASSAVEAEIETASFKTRSRPRDRAVRSAQFLNAARFPVMTFRSESVSADGSAVRGTLTVGDVSRPVSLSVGAVTVTAQSFETTAQARIDRTEFGITAMPGLAGRRLNLTLETRWLRT